MEKFTLGSVPKTEKLPFSNPFLLLASHLLDLAYQLGPSQMIRKQQKSRSKMSSFGFSIHSLFWIAISVSTACLALPPNELLPASACIGGEAIFFSPNSETISYAIFATEGDPTTNPLNQSIIDNRLDRYHTGYRVKGAVNFCGGAFLAARFSWLVARGSSQIEIPVPSGPPFSQNLAPILVGPSFDGLIYSFASDKRKFTYNAVDGIVGLPILRSRSLCLSAWGGVHWAELTSHDKFTYIVPFVPSVGANDLIIGELRDRFWGVGPLVGSRIESSLACGFFLSGSVSAALLVGKAKDENLSTVTGFVSETTQVFDIESKGRPGRAVPYGNLRAGIGYCLCVPASCLSFTIEVGYEGIIYHDALVQIRNLQLLEDASLRNVTMHGPYISGVLGF